MNAHRLAAVLCACVTACGTNSGAQQANTTGDETRPSPTTGHSSAASSNSSMGESSAGVGATSQASAATSSGDTERSNETHSASSPQSNDTATQSDSDASTPSSTSASNSDAGINSETEVDATPAPAGEPTEEQLAPVPTPRGEHGVGALLGDVYVLGGFTPSVTSSVQAYSPTTDQWRDAADFPVVFHHPNVATVNDQLYVLGFHAGSGQRQADGSAYAYNPETDAWTAVTSMPPGTERGASCVTTYQNKIYVFGGTNGQALPDASVYDPATDEWETLPFVPATRHHCIAAELNGKIYIVSGRDVVIEEVQAESYVFDPIAKTFQQVAPILTPRGGAAGGLLGGRIYVFGGEGNSGDPRGIFHQTEAYDPATDSWQALPDMEVPRHGLGGVVIGDRIYLPAGSLSQGIDVTDTFSVFYLK